MTAADGSRLSRLDVDLWVDLDQVVSVRTYTGQLLERRVEIILTNGTAFEVEIGPKPGSGNPLTDEERDDLERAWLLDHFGDLLEGVDHGKAQS